MLCFSWMKYMKYTCTVNYRYEKQKTFKLFFVIMFLNDKLESSSWLIIEHIDSPKTAIVPKL